jgi:acyl-coenzyme A synthetase/AMP-(fatty) acid ligase
MSELAASDPGYELSIEEVPAVETLYPRLGKEKGDDAFEPYPPYTTRPPLSDVAMYLHSSGSTGLPKAIPQTHLILIHWVAFRELFLPYENGRSD